MSDDVPSACQGYCRVHVRGSAQDTAGGVASASFYACKRFFGSEISKSQAQTRDFKTRRYFVSISPSHLYLRIHHENILL